jgi:pyridoxamine 5'-phosphate oxidase-like protein
MSIERSTRGYGRTRLTRIARELLDASTLCAISTVSPHGRPHVNTAYFARHVDLRLVWLSDPRARHSRNIGPRGPAAVAVYDSSQGWGGPDRGIQLFGSAGVVTGAPAEAERIYAGRFAGFSREEFADYRLYVFRPRRIKLFDEPSLGAGVFVTAKVQADGKLAWERTDIYYAV